jgi:hypothetical protein
MQSKELLAWRRFYDAKVGVTNLPPLEESHPRDSGSTQKYLGAICSELFFELLGSFILRMVTPLNFAHLNDLTMSHALYRIQNLNWPLIVCRSPPRSSSSIDSCFSGTHKHFLRCDTSNTLCTSDNCRGNSS